MKKNNEILAESRSIEQSKPDNKPKIEEEIDDVIINKDIKTIKTQKRSKVRTISETIAEILDKADLFYRMVAGFLIIL